MLALAATSALALGVGACGGEDAAPTGGDGQELSGEIRIDGSSTVFPFAEAALAKLEDELADPSSWGDGKRAQDATARHRAAKDAIEALYAELELVAG